MLAAQPLTALTIELTRAPRGVRVSVDAGSMSQGFEIIEVAFEEIDRIAEDLRFLLERANLFGEMGLAATDEIERLGLLLFDLVTPRNLKDILRRLPAGSVITLRLDESLQHIPWEFMHTGRDFLARQLSIGRVIERYGIEPPPQRRGLEAGAKRALIVCDPRADLPASAAEGLSLCEFFQGCRGVEVSLKTHPVGRADLREQLREHDIVHFAGHVEWEVPNSAGGWALCDGHFGAADVEQLAGGRLMPALVFANACASAAARGGVDHMARSLMSAGAVNVIGTLWDIPDALGAVFAHSFYDDLSRGVSVGEALRRARIELAYHHGEGAMLWGSYVLYGPPEQRYFTADAATEGDDDVAFAPAVGVSQSRRRETVLLAVSGSMMRASRPGRGDGAWALRSHQAGVVGGDVLVGDASARLLRQVRFVVGVAVTLMVGLAALFFLLQPTRRAPAAVDAAALAAAQAQAERYLSEDVQQAAETIDAARAAQRLQEVPPPPLPEADLALIAQVHDESGQAQAQPLTPGDVLRPDAHLRVVVNPHHSAYACLLYVRHDGLVQVLPLGEGEEVMYLRAHQAVALPGPDRWFSPSHVPGPAAVMLLQSREPIEGLSALTKDLRGVVLSAGQRSDALKALPLAALEERLLEEVDTVTTFEVDLSSAAAAATPWLLAAPLGETP